jgi:hypothetical protein
MCHLLMMSLTSYLLSLLSKMAADLFILCMDILVYVAWYCHMPPSYVLYKGTYVPYDGTFGVPDQGQMLDV